MKAVGVIAGPCRPHSAVSNVSGFRALSGFIEEEPGRPCSAAQKADGQTSRSSRPAGGAVATSHLSPQRSTSPTAQAPPPWQHPSFPLGKDGPGRPMVRAVGALRRHHIRAVGPPGLVAVK
ncbi:hypothetical protein MC885_003284 [Smutsia gigantea]|nr:hypothetical protein MC885_003284 [Smutsia gigantea]